MLVERYRAPRQSMTMLHTSLFQRTTGRTISPSVCLSKTPSRPPLTLSSVKEARRRGTIYLMKHRWLIDSISINKGRLCDETLPQYTWEKEHAKRVLSKMKRRQQDVKKATKTAKIAKIAAKIVGQTDGESGFAAHSGNDRGGTPKTVQSVEDVPNDVRRKPQVPRSSPKQIIDCGMPHISLGLAPFC